MSTFSSFDEIELHYTDTGAPYAPVVVLLHGFAADAEANWQRPGVIEALKAEGYRVIALDARGHGQSEKPHDPKAYADEAMVHDVQSLLDFLDVENCDVVGYSMGSMIASRLAARDPRVKRLVLGGVGKRARFAMPEPVMLAIADALEADDADDIDTPAARAISRLRRRDACGPRGLGRYPARATVRRPRPGRDHRPDSGVGREGRRSCRRSREAGRRHLQRSGQRHDGPR